MTSLFGSVKYTCGPKKNWQHIFLKSLGVACSEKVITLLVIRVAHALYICHHTIRIPVRINNQNINCNEQRLGDSLSVVVYAAYINR